VSKERPFIAIVDDDESVRKALQRLLRSAGFANEAFSTGDGFLESLRSRRPDCVVLDLHMPRVTGFDVLAQLALDDSRVPVVIVTGHDSSETHDRAMAAGATQYLSKPVNDNALLDAIHKSLEAGSCP
jgi:FixJ family two-component response regulator